MQPAAAKKDGRTPRVRDSDVGVVILAGGEATRFPGKLASDAGGIPLLLRVYRNVRAIGPVYVSANAVFGENVARELDCTIVPDDRPGRGPLGGLVSTFERVCEERCFVVAGDAPFVDASVYQHLLQAWSEDVAAVVAERSWPLDPLFPLYSRGAFLSPARPVLAPVS